MGLLSFRFDATFRDGLPHLAKYRYGCVDKSFLTKYVLRAYWEWCTTLFPLWMAPNLITLIGFGFAVSNLLLVLFFVPDLIGPAPSFVYLCMAANLWIYSTFDNVDGKQARRTGSSSPLGELFDHGCDALNCTYGALAQAAALGLGRTWLAVFMFFYTCVPFYLSTWEEYHTGVLYLGYLNGPTEGIVTGCLLMLVASAFGPGVFHMSCASLGLGELLPERLASLSLLELLLPVAMFSVIFFHGLPCIWNVVMHTRGTKGSVVMALSQLLPMMVFCGLIIAWLAASPTLMEKHFLLFLSALSFSFGRIATKMILCHLLGLSFPYVTVHMLPLLFGAIDANAPLLFGLPSLLASGQREEVFLWCYLGFASLTYLHWAITVITEFSSALHIRPFSITKRANKSS